MKLKVWAIALAATLCSQAALAAPQAALFQDFIRDCASHPGDPVAALNDVSQQGWKMTPQNELMAKLAPISFPGLKMNWYQFYQSAQPGRSIALLGGRGELSLASGEPAIPVGFCLTMQKPIDPASEREAGSWTGVSPLMTAPEGTIYIYTDAASGRQSMKPSQAYSDFKAGDGRELVTLSHPNENTTGIMLIGPVSGTTK